MVFSNFFIKKSQYLDINECTETTLPMCDENGSCRNTEGSFMCVCNDGYTGNGMSCEGTLVFEYQTKVGSFLYTLY